MGNIRNRWSYSPCIELPLDGSGTLRHEQGQVARFSNLVDRNGGQVEVCFADKQVVEASKAAQALSWERNRKLS